jgi:hypothetical protein
MSRTRVVVALAAVVALAGTTGALAHSAPAAAPTHQPRLMPTLDRVLSGPALTPPAPPCPLPKVKVPLPDTPVPLVGGDTTVGPCVMVPELAGTGAPVMGNMAYWGGRVQVHPRVYLVYFGWGRAGAFDDDCTPVRLVEGKIRATLKCDPDGAGKKMADFVHQLGGTEWAGVQSQYYQVVNGVTTYVHNDRNQLGGIWVDDKNKVTAKISYRDMAVEADRARKHFGIKDKDLYDANVVILQPKRFSDPKAESVGYCAWHDIIEPSVMPDEFKGLKADLPFTNMPYVLNQGDGCGAHLVNSVASPGASTASRSPSATRSRRPSPIRERRTASAARPSAGGSTRSTRTRTATSARTSAGACSVVPSPTSRAGARTSAAAPAGCSPCSRSGATRPRTAWATARARERTCPSDAVAVTARARGAPRCAARPAPVARGTAPACSGTTRPATPRSRGRRPVTGPR